MIGLAGLGKFIFNFSQRQSQGGTTVEIHLIVYFDSRLASQY